MGDRKTDNIGERLVRAASDIAGMAIFGGVNNGLDIKVKSAKVESGEDWGVITLVLGGEAQKEPAPEKPLSDKERACASQAIEDLTTEKAMLEAYNDTLAFCLREAESVLFSISARLGKEKPAPALRKLCRKINSALKGGE